MKTVNVMFMVDKDLMDEFMCQCETLNINVNTALCELVKFQVETIKILNKTKEDLKNDRK